MLITTQNLRHTDNYEHQNICVNNNSTLTNMSQVHQRGSVRHRAAREFPIQRERGLALTQMQGAVVLVRN
jgi:hypothetical protein